MLAKCDPQTLQNQKMRFTLAARHARQLSKPEEIAIWLVLPEPFSPETGTVCPVIGEPFRRETCAGMYSQKLAKRSSILKN